MTTTIAPSVRPRFGLTARNVWNSVFYARTNGETGEVYDPQGFLFATTPDPTIADIIVDAMNEEDFENDSEPDENDADDEAYDLAVDNLCVAAQDLLSEIAAMRAAPAGLHEKAHWVKNALRALKPVQEARQ